MQCGKPLTMPLAQMRDGDLVQLVKFRDMFVTSCWSKFIQSLYNSPCPDRVYRCIYRWLSDNIIYAYVHLNAMVCAGRHTHKDVLNKHGNKLSFKN